ncbi:MAG TPA: hypothetical protein DEP57_05025 [Selenomonas sp.]|nr:hypothetical protein [Selenomonas sp.]
MLMDSSIRAFNKFSNDGNYSLSPTGKGDRGAVDEVHMPAAMPGESAYVTTGFGPGKLLASIA